MDSGINESNDGKVNETFTFEFKFDPDLKPFIPSSVTVEDTSVTATTSLPVEPTAAPVSNDTVNTVTDGMEAISLSSSIKSTTDADKTVAAVEKQKKKNDTGKSVSSVKKEDLEKDTREIYNIVFIGHVDVGKSTIGGQLLLLTGMVDKRTMEKYEKEAKEKNRESWYLSWALDINSEERDKGKTVEVGKAYFETVNKRIILLDAPGHKGFVPNMIGGTAQADIAVMVVSARKGEFETGFERGGQTQEHALIAKIAGSKRFIVLVNKMDDPTVKWSQTRFQEIEKKLSPFLKKIGFKLSEITFIPVSGFTGANLKDPVSKDICSWYSGCSFLEYIDKLDLKTSDLDKPARLIVTDRYKDMGSTIVAAKIMSGYVGKNDSFILMPKKLKTKIVSILGLDDEELTVAKCGESARLKMSDIDEQDIAIGNILCKPGDLCDFGSVFEAQLMILDCKTLITSGYNSVMHIHSAIEEVRLSHLLFLIDKKTGEKTQKLPRFVKQDQACIARFKLNSFICMAAFATTPELGRFTLRDEGRTVAVGKIIRVINPTASTQNQ